MASEQYPLRRSGIYRNLPTFDASIKGLTAIVVGATGISGFNTIRCLLDSPSRWKTIYALSRSPLSKEMLSLLSPEQQSRIQHISVDLTQSAEKTSSSLTQAGVNNVDYVFFYGYVHPHGKNAMDPAMEDALVETNVPIFEKFLTALDQASLIPRRVLLQTGGKHYGGHIGRAQRPYVESDPPPKHLSRNFYYPQEETLFKFCKQHPGTGWNVIRPFGVIGATSNASMNFLLPFAFFSAVQAHKGEPLYFAGDVDEWQYEHCHSSARLTGYLAEWAVLEEKCANQAFNAQDGCPVSWNRLLPEIARWYNVPGEIVGPEADESKYHKIEFAGGKACPLGFGPPTGIRLARTTFAQWSRDPSNQAAWESIMRESQGKISLNPFEDPNRELLSQGDFAYYMIGQPSISKVRRFGFNGFVDTVESLFEMYQEMAQMGIVDAPKVEAANPLV